MKRCAISVIRLKRSFIYQPLAAILAVLMMPMFSGFGGEAGIEAFQASAGVIGPSKSIIRNACVGSSCYITDVGQLETDAVQAYLGLHKLPPGDAHIIYDYGRADLRNAIRGIIFNILLEIINKPASERTMHEQVLYEWLRGLVQQNEIEQYRVAIAEFNRWQREPCTFTLDSVIASEYEISYNGAPFCGRNFSNLFLAPDVPDQTYFTALGLKNSYGKPASTFSYFGSLVADTGINVAAVAGISAGIAAAVVAGASAVLIKSLSLALAAGIGTAGVASKSVAFVLSGATVSALGSAFIVAGAVTIVLIAIAIGVAAGIRTFNNQANLNALNNLNNDLKQVTDTPPDLSAFATDTSGLGLYKLESTLAAQTVPDVPATAKLPVHSDSDLNFAIQKSTQTKPTVHATLEYQDWNGNDWSAQTWGGWFVQTCNSAGKCTQADSINANLRYVDWSGVNWTAMRMGDKFISTKNKPAPTDKDCPPDPTTGVSPGPDFDKCISYVSTSIPLKAPGGVLEHVSLSVLPPSRPPVFTSGSTLQFTPGVRSIQTITASGQPTPKICLSSIEPPLPPEFSLNNRLDCSNNGSFDVGFNGEFNTRELSYQLTLTASNGTTDSPVVQTFTIDVSQHLGITSPGILSGTAGFPVNFRVTTTGFPPPSLSVSPSLLEHFPGLKFTDNGNGTGTFSGASERPGHWACLTIDGKANCGIIASSSQGTIVQGFGINLAPAPAATLGPPAGATFIAGVSNTVVVASTGAQTHVSWHFKSAPPWMVLMDNGDGTATLLGNPPAGTNGTFTAEIAPVAAGSDASVTPVFTSFPVTVVNQPIFLSPDSATFTVGSQGSFEISANEGNIGLVGTLPAGLSFTGGNPAIISGIPIPGSGGQYLFDITLKSPGTPVTISKSLILNVDEAPSIISSTKANFPTGLPGSFTVSTIGFPSISAYPVAQPPTPPTGPSEGKGMYFTVTGLPASLRASNLNPQGLATGALTIEGTPSAGEAGTYRVQIAAQNGVGVTAHQTLILNILRLASVPASGAECSGAYTGAFAGDIGVSAGQNCMFIGGSVLGSVTVIGGNFVLSHAKVTGNVQIQGWSEFSISSDSEIGGDLTMQDLTLNFGNDLCASRVAGNVLVLDNAIPIEIGSPLSTCPGNTIGGNLAISANWDPIDVYNNRITKTLSCTGNLSIEGHDNTAEVKEGQCTPF